MVLPLSQLQGRTTFRPLPGAGGEGTGQDGAGSSRAIPFLARLAHQGVVGAEFPRRPAKKVWDMLSPRGGEGVESERRRLRSPIGCSRGFSLFVTLCLCVKQFQRSTP